MISTILHKEFITINSHLNIIWTECPDDSFKKFIESLGHSLLSFNDIYYGALYPNLIICNNKLHFFDQCRIFSIQYHLPVLLIDHQIRSNLLDSTKISTLNNFPCVYSIATSKKISESWNNKHDQILSYTINNEESQSIWKNLIYQTAKKTFIL